eukprot:Skav222631  [mRNA]  locus=scaffold10:173207:178337:- [translate_table: standard]
MCDRPSAFARNTSARLDRDLLMFCVSFSRSPVEPDFSSRSDPARSTRCSAPVNSQSSSRLTPCRYMAKMEWDRDDVAFISVAPTALALAAFSIKRLT